MRSKIVLIKLAAMGDVTLACRALKEFASKFDTPLEVHWIIDRGLVGLGEALIRHGAGASNLTVHWHSIDAARLFRGGALEKAHEAARMLRIVARLQPQHLVLLHRDWRYLVALRPVYRGSMVFLTRKKIHELDAYDNALTKLARRLRLTESTKPAPKAKTHVKSGRIGILIGGAQNQKITFREKRWPKIDELVRGLLERSQNKVVLYGGPDDLDLEHALLSGIKGGDRLESLVGKLKMHELPKSLETLDAFVSIDSGLGHIASIVMDAPGQKVISLFGPTDPRVWAPRSNGQGKVQLHYKSKPCSPCYADTGEFKPCKYSGEQFQHCMTDISTEEVLSSLLQD